ncbi:MAG: elongation factor P [Spirochaetales bacterium]|nr:MAG: elongation factor P [Spirochaetales bacterium]
MIGTGDIKKGLTIALNGTLYTIVDWQHIKSGRGSAQIKLKLRDLRGGHTIEYTCQSGEKFERATLDRHTVQFLYNDGDLYYFMDSKTFEQTPLNKKQLGNAVDYLKENLILDTLNYNDEVVSVELPNSIELKVIQTDPGFRGDTATNVNKPGKLETGITIPIPLFVNQGDVIRVDTRTGQYLERVN